MKKDINALRDILFAQLHRLAEAGEYDIELELKKAAAITQVSDNIIRTAEVENQFIALTQSKGTSFISSDNTDSAEGNASNILVSGKHIFNSDERNNWLVNEGKDKNNENE